MKQILNQEKDNVKTVEKPCGIFTCPCPATSLTWQQSLTAAHVPSLGPQALVPDGAQQNILTSYCVCVLICLGAT